MPAFTSERSKRVLSELHPDLQAVATVAIKHIDFQLIEGARSLNRQRELYRDGLSTLNPDDPTIQQSRHLATPAEAFDFLPYPLPENDWNNRPLFTAYAHFFIGIGYVLGVPLIWGGDWDGDFEWKDQRFHDFPHIQLR